MNRSRTFNMADRHVFDGQLAEWLRERRAGGLTIDQITDALRRRGVDVSRETVRKWILALNDQEAGVA